MKPVLERFEAKYIPEPTSGCWLWDAYTMPNGYGLFGMGGTKNNDYAHRASWRLYRGEIPKGMCVCHHCDNRACVNPDHLFLGTWKDNSHDMLAKGRGLTGEKANGAKLTADDVRAIRSDDRTLIEIAADFGVTFTNISAIKLRRTWAHVT